MVKVVNIAELGNNEWTFLEDHIQNKNIRWQHITGNPQSALERVIRRPKISRYRAILQACFYLRETNSLVISHMPRMTHWQSKIMKIFSLNRKHIAFSLNFTNLPSQRTIQSMKKSFSSVDRFVVYSSFEKQLYSSLFDIPEEKITMLHWAMETPEVDKQYRPERGEYYCAAGGEGRDYTTLINVFKSLPQLTLVIVTRPGTVETTALPSNIKILYNLSSQKYWSSVKNSKAVLIPLSNEDTACGHISIVGAMKLKRPVITTYSLGTTDYVEHDKTALVTPNRDVQKLRNAVISIHEQHGLGSRLAESAYRFTEEKCNILNWAAFLEAELKEPHSYI